MNSLFTICFANWLWNNYLFRVFAMNSLSQFHDSLTNSLSVSRNHFQYTIFFAHYFTINSLSYSPIHYVFANSLWNHNLFREFNFNVFFVATSLFFRYLSRGFFLTSLSFSRIYFESTFFFADSFNIKKLYRKLCLNQPSL